MSYTSSTWDAIYDDDVEIFKAFQEEVEQQDCNYHNFDNGYTGFEDKDLSDWEDRSYVNSKSLEPPASGQNNTKSMAHLSAIKKMAEVPTCIVRDNVRMGASSMSTHKRVQHYREIKENFFY